MSILGRNLVLIALMLASACGNSSSDGNDPPPLDPVDIRLTRVFDTIPFNKPVLLLQAPGDSRRWYVVEQGGRVRTFASGDTDASDFIDLTAEVISSGELGLLGMAFDPGFAVNRRVYLSWTRDNGGLESVIARYTVNAAGDAVVPDSRQIILRVSQPAGNHNGGHIAFGPDGYLYIGLGDGGGGNDSYRNAQNTRTLLGSLLRIDVSGDGETYAIPPDNPFVGDARVRDEIFAYGLRNPWRWSFDRRNGRLYAGDVGQGALEEIDHVEAGKQYGWPCFEGTRVNDSVDYGDYCRGVSNTPPIHEYPRSEGIAVVGGYVYRGDDERLRSLRGRYFFADYGSGRLWSLYPLADRPSDTLKLMVDSDHVISSLSEDLAGRLYLLDWARGEVYRIDAGND